MSPFSIKITVPESDLVQPYAHVHHAQIFRYLERAREQFLESRGLPLQRLLDRGEFLVISDLQAKFLREIVSEELSITCEQPEIEGKKIIIPQQIIKENGKTALKAVVTCQLLLKSEGRAVSPRGKLLEALLASTGGNSMALHADKKSRNDGDENPFFL